MRTPTGAMGSPSAARRSSLSSLGRPSSQATACARARLQLGLQQLMLSGPRAVSAFPVDEEMDVWMATAQCPPGGPHGGAALSLRLTFDLSKGLDECLPTVELLQPACFHPNVGEGGLLCPQALRERCKPLDLVGEVLRRVVELIGRPCFSTRPLNAEAAACWFDDPTELRERINAAMQ